MGADGDKSGLLRELRIAREQREEPQAFPLRKGLILLLILLIAGALSTYAFLRGRRIEVDTATAIAAGAAAGPASVLQATGYVTARREATVSAQITGTLTQVLIEEGERVQQGQVLARLDDTAQEAALAQAEAQLQAATALRVQYQAQLDQARRDLKRDQELVDVDAVSRQSAEQAQTQVDSLAAQVTAQEKQQALAQAGIEAARVQLGYTVIRAPFAGVIVAKAAQAGEIVSPISAGGGFTRTGIGTIVDMDSLEIEVDVNEAYINRVQPMQPAQAVLDAYQDWIIPAHVIAIIPTADRSKATVKVRIGIDRKDPRILPDMGVRVSFLEAANGRTSTQPQPQGVFVPAGSVVERDGRSVVFTVNAGRAHAQAVTSGESAGDLRRVEGIAAGTVIVRAPPDDLSDGAAVAVRQQ